MIYTVFPKTEYCNTDMPHDCESWEEALAYCKDKGWVAGRDCVIESTEGDCE